jgi:hypothetical protein
MDANYSIVKYDSIIDQICIFEDFHYLILFKLTIFVHLFFMYFIKLNFLKHHFFIAYLTRTDSIFFNYFVQFNFVYENNLIFVGFLASIVIILFIFLYLF